MNNITGIKSVDFKITAEGHGVINWNGPMSLQGKGGKTVDNHTMPKLRGYTNLTGEVSENGFHFKKKINDVKFNETPLYISANCIRHHLFKSQSYDLHFASKKNMIHVIASLTGLIRGFVVPQTQNKKTTALIVEDFVEQKGNGNFEQFSRSGEKKEKGSETTDSSFFSKLTFGDTAYISYATLSIEELQFISLDKKFDREAMEIKKGQGEEVAQTIQEFIKTLDPTLEPVVTYHDNWVRKGAIFNQGQAGILLNQDAIQILVNTTIKLLEDLSIRQARSYMYVTSVDVDYNNSNKMMRIKKNEELDTEKNEDFAIYYEAREEGNVDD